MASSQAESPEQITKTYYLRLNENAQNEDAKAFETTENCTLVNLIMKAQQLFPQKRISIVYNERGKQLKRLSEVPDGATLVLSCGEPFYGKKFFLVENGRPKTSLGTNDKRPYRSNGNLQKLLADATAILHLAQDAKIAFTEDGKQILSIDDIQDSDPKNPKAEAARRLLSNGKGIDFGDLEEGQTIIISTGTKFVHLLTDKERREKLNFAKSHAFDNASLNDDTLSRAQNLGKQDITDKRSTKSAMTAITTTNVPKSHYARYHQLLAVLPGSVEDHIRDSMLATYVSLPEDYRAAMKDRQTYETMLRETQIHLFVEQLVHQMICCQQSTSSINTPIDGWALSVLQELSMNDIHFAITGPRYSGKTMMLSRLATLLYRKLNKSDQRDRYLMFPFNVSPHALELETPLDLYLSVVNIVFDSVRYSRFDLIPFLLTLRQWFLSAPTMGTLIKLPAELYNLPNIDANEIYSMGKQVHSLFHSTDSDLSEFLHLIFRFPLNMAQAIGLRSAVYIIDHFDCCTPDVAKSISQILTTSQKESRTSPSKGNATKPKPFIPFIVASQTDKYFTKLFNVKGTSQLNSEHSIDVENYQDVNGNPETRELFISDLMLRFGLDALMGCPGFIASFVNLCDIVEKNALMNQNINIKGTKFSQITPKIIDFRKAEIEQEFKKFALSLAMANSSIITYDVLNRIDTVSPISIKIMKKDSE